MKLSAKFLALIFLLGAQSASAYTNDTLAKCSALNNNFNQKYGILKNKLNYRNIDKVLNFSKKKKIKFIEFSKDYNSLKLKSKNFQRDSSWCQ